MPGRNSIEQQKGEELYSIEQYPEGYFLQHDPSRIFNKWAAVEVWADAPVPANMERLVVPAGGYAVFSYKGPVSRTPELFAYIFNQWLPDSDFEVDNRPHLGVMGKRYSNDADDSEEEFWIPVKPKA